MGDTSASSPTTRKGPFMINASHIARAHTLLALAAFGVALCVGVMLHYKKIVKNGVAGYPEEWFPSVSATIGDWYPERNLFQILIALTSGPRFALVSLQYYLHRSPTSSLPTVVFLSGLIRTVSCGGWVYITSSDDHDVHDFFMITYIVFNIPWMIGSIACTPEDSQVVRRKRSMVSTAFFVSIVPLVYFFIQHKVYRIPGAYTRYSFFEWSLIMFDVLFDSITEEEFKKADLQIYLGSSLKHGLSNDDIRPSEKVKEQVVADSATIVTLAEKTKAPIGTSISGMPPPYTSWNLLRQAVSKEWRQPISFISDLYLSYTFWSVFTSLIPTLFYFSVWELGIAGHELALLSTLSPILLSISPFLSWARTRGGLATLHALSFTCIAAYVLDKPLHRLYVVAFASSVAVLRQVVEWSDGDVAYQGILTGLGLLVSSLSKHANHSNNPVWPFVTEKSGGYNKLGLALALASLLEFYYRPSSSSSSREPSRIPPTPEKSVLQSPQSPHWLSGAIPLGSLLFTLHTLLSDSSTLIAWSWTGYENGLPRGPLPHLHGSITLVIQCLGLLLPVALVSSADTTNLRKMLSHPVWFLYGCASSFVMYRYKNWLGYAGALNLAFFTMSIVPTVLQHAASTRTVARTYFSAMLVYCILSLASVWTVAYAFVPGGVYMRERTDLVVLAQMVCLSLAFQWPRNRQNDQNASTPINLTLTPSTRSHARTVLAAISTLSVLVTLYRLPSSSPQPFRQGPRIMRAGIWTLHFGIDNEGRDSQRRVRDLISDMELDVVGLLETDLHRNVYGNRDLTRVIIEDMGYHVDLGPGPNSHTWGAVLLSKFPIINSTHHLLPSPHGELAPAIEAVLDVFGTSVTVVVAHNGQEEDPLDRELQSKELARIMDASPHPVIFLGYVVTKPHAARPAPYDILVTDGRVHDIDKDDPDRWCEYIFYRGLYRTSYARISRSTITDTELQIGQFVLPKHGSTVTNDTQEARYLRSYKEQLDQDHWFPMPYYQQNGGVNGHFYHVFGTPLYYQIPGNAEV